MQTCLADLHVHTVLSPCAQVEMIPPLIVQSALERGIGILAITDHNASANVIAVQQAALGSGLVVLPGMELQTREEVHLLCLFDTLEQLQHWQAHVDALLPHLKNQPEFLGEQFIVDETGDYIRSEERLLLTSVNIKLESAISEVTALGGLAIPAHVDRKAFGLLSNLGFVPAHPDLVCLEISRFIRPEQAIRKWPQIARYPLIQNSDAHQLDGFLGVTELSLESPCIAEIRLALSGQLGRRLCLLSHEYS
jgi:3',5'-nucleoside bisphosphate phosphatase